MKAVLQRVRRARVEVEGQTVAEISGGLLILLGVGPEDTEQNAAALARKIANLRIFADLEGKMNLSLLDVAGAAIVVSQFTLFADIRKGNRPAFVSAGAPEHARVLCDRFAALLAAQGVPTQTGEFGAHMQVELINDGPVTILMEM
jgi:D-tyrosyl-tRNA(Tyr) deacylase